MQRCNKYIKWSAILFIIFFIYRPNIYGQITLSKLPELQKIDVIEQLGDQLPLDVEFINDNGDTILLANYFNRGKPVVLTLAYYRCPMLCGLVLKGLAEGVSKLSYTAGQEYLLVTISINPDESYNLAAAKNIILPLLSAGP